MPGVVWAEQRAAAFGAGESAADERFGGRER